MRKPLVQASHFGIKDRSKNHVCSNPLRGPHFYHFWGFVKKRSIVGPLQNLVGAKRENKIDQVAQNGVQNIVTHLF